MTTADAFILGFYGVMTTHVHEGGPIPDVWRWVTRTWELRICVFFRSSMCDGTQSFSNATFSAAKSPRSFPMVHAFGGQSLRAWTSNAVSSGALLRATGRWYIVVFSYRRIALDVFTFTLTETRDACGRSRSKGSDTQIIPEQANRAR